MNDYTYLGKDLSEMTKDELIAALEATAVLMEELIARPIDYKEMVRRALRQEGIIG